MALTGAISDEHNERATNLRERATLQLIGIICQRQDRPKVKPALQALAYFLQKDVVTVSSLTELYLRTSPEHREKRETTDLEVLHGVFASFLAWVVHHDTALSAGHLIRSFLGAKRRQRNAGDETGISLLWMRPVIDTLRDWPDRLQEFKTHVFPYCFLPDTTDYLAFLSFLHFGRHVQTAALLPAIFRTFDGDDHKMSKSEEFSILLAAIQTGKELGIVKDVGRFSEAKLCAVTESRTKIIDSTKVSRLRRAYYI